LLFRDTCTLELDRISLVHIDTGDEELI